MKEYIGQEKNKLATWSVPRLIVSLAVPAIIAQMVNAFYNIIDRIYIGRIPGIGDMALTGVGVCFPVLILISGFAQMIGVGGSTFAAIEYGKKNREKTEKILGNSFLILILLSVSLTVFFQIAKTPVLMAFGASTETISYGVQYLTIYLTGTIFVQMTLGLNPFITCQGRSKIAMMTILIGAGLNLALDPVFIFVLGMGVRGAAVATVLSQAVSALWILRFLLSSKSEIRLYKRNLPLQKTIVKTIFGMGVSSFVMQITECLIQVVFNSGLQKYGGDYYVACMTIIQSTMQMIFTFTNGITQGVQPVISYNYGAQKNQRVRSAYRIGFFSHISVAVVCCLLLMLFPGFFASFFTENQEIIAITRKMLPIYICGQGIFGIQSAAQCTFVGLGQIRISMFLACLRKVILIIPLALLLPCFVGVTGVFLAEPIADITSATVAGILFFKNIRSILQKGYTVN